ncbi:ATP-binding protein [Acinetobacter sp. WCHAc010034]|uniref:ATP-binding protein n=1 Tax=Acinetobacter sp. WCHAc010034 TaxID=1879049 RepID=UPI00083A0D26|nr:ATP-binding protein [Acinetobacter sp. WCHAc010034]AYA01717.1 ATP-binding protein [Acinetobacter sp. WCHAc010034]
MIVNKISNIYIRDLFNNHNICWSIKDVNVLVGKNGLGKSTILELIKASVTKDINSRALKLCHGIQIVFDENQPNEAKNHLFNPATMQDEVLNRLTKDDFLDQIINNIKKTNQKINKNNKDLRNELIKRIINEVNSDVNTQAISQNTIELPVEYISTVSMSANSINNINTSDGNTVNFLNYEIREQIQKLLKSPNHQENIEKLISVLNNMFSDSQKKVVLQDGNFGFNEHCKIEEYSTPL